MPDFTVPDNIQYPVGTDPVAPLAEVFENLALSAQVAITDANDRITAVDNELNATKITELNDIPNVEVPSPLLGQSLVFDGFDWVSGYPLILETSQQTSNYTLALGDAGKIVPMNISGTGSVTIPLNSSVAFPVGTVVGVYNLSSSELTVAGAAGVTVRNGGVLAQYREASLRKRDTDEWVVLGNVS